MRKISDLLPLAALTLLTGCTGTLTNLSPDIQQRRPDGLYPMAVAFQTRQDTVRWNTIKAFVVVDNHVYPMRPMPLMSNRWETLIPVAPDQKEIKYRYKLDWQYNAIPDPQNDSQQSKPKVLRIVD